MNITDVRLTVTQVPRFIALLKTMGVTEENIWEIKHDNGTLRALLWWESFQDGEFAVAHKVTVE